MTESKEEKITVETYNYSEKAAEMNQYPYSLNCKVDCATLAEAAKIALNESLNAYCDDYGGTKVKVNGRLIFQSYNIPQSIAMKSDYEFYDEEFEKLYVSELETLLN